jgi:hypothetical protein
MFLYSNPQEKLMSVLGLKWVEIFGEAARLFHVTWFLP